MRLKNIERGESLKSRLIFAMIRTVTGFRAPDVFRTLIYRGQFFGSPHNEHTQAVMRGPSKWTIAERELFAAYVSNLNRCRF